MKVRLLMLAALIPVATVRAQQVPGAETTEPQITDSTQSVRDMPDEGRDVVNDPTSLTGRGGAAIRTNRTFQETIGTRIYTPIGTSIGTAIGVPH